MKTNEEETKPIFSSPPVVVQPLQSVPPGAKLFGVRFTQNQLVLGGSFFVVALGVLLGCILTPSSKDPPPWDRISSIIGWIYFNAWSISFFPQLYLNYVRKSVAGQSFDYLFLNVLGFTGYTIYTWSFYASSAVQEDYRNRFGNDNTVDANDVGFATFAALACYYNAWQVYVYDRAGQGVHKATIAFIFVAVLGSLLWTLLLVCGVHTEHVFNVLDLLYGVSLIKLVVSIIKYLPQIHLNYKRKLTIGWNIWNVLLDFSGGTLSITQQIIDCWTTDRWNGIAGNPVKFLLGSFSMICDVVMMIQHYGLYSANNHAVMEVEHRARQSIQQQTA